MRVHVVHVHGKNIFFTYHKFHLFCLPITVTMGI